MPELYEKTRHNYYLIGIITSLVMLTSFVIGKFTTLEAQTDEMRRQLDAAQLTMRAFENKYITKDETLLRLQQIENNLNEIKEILKKR